MPPLADSVRLTSAQATAQQPAQEDELDRELEQDVERMMKRLEIPKEVPGSQAPRPSPGPRDPDRPEIQEAIIQKIFPNLPVMPLLELPECTPGRRCMTLGELQDLMYQYNPLLVQVRADVRSFLGTAIQAGTPPNPIFGYESDTVGSSRTRDYQGIYLSQIVITAGKLRLAQQVANMDAMNAQLTVRKTRFFLSSRVKAAYFLTLVARENFKIADALVKFTEQSYEIQRDKYRAGEGTGYEPAQLRTLAVQARAARANAQIHYIAMWKQLATLLGLPDLPPAPLEGQADMPPPDVKYEDALIRVLNVHPDIVAGRNMERQAEVQLRLERLKPIPDVYVYGTFQKDFTTPGFQNTSYNTQLGVPLPIFNRNRGNIINAEGDLMRAREQVRRVQLDLTQQLVDAFERYSANRVQLAYYRDQILPDLATTYRGTYERHALRSDLVGFADVVFAQQNLAAGVTTYIGLLNAQWLAIADLANLMQAETVSEMELVPRPDDNRPPAPRGDGNAAPPPDNGNRPAMPDRNPANRAEQGKMPAPQLRIIRPVANEAGGRQ